MTTFRKDPDARLDYEVDWTAWLGDDTIASSAWLPGSGSGDDSLVVDSDSHTDTAAKVWLSAGDPRPRGYKLTNRITTAGGRTEDRTITITVAER